MIGATAVRFYLFDGEAAGAGLLGVVVAPGEAGVADLLVPSPLLPPSEAPGPFEAFEVFEVFDSLAGLELCLLA
jgi:hypothetical protein